MAFTEADFLLAPPRKCQITMTAHSSSYLSAITLTKWPGNGALLESAKQLSKKHPKPKIHTQDTVLFLARNESGNRSSSYKLFLVVQRSDVQR